MAQAGRHGRAGDLLAEVETDKANMELEAFDEGRSSEIRTAEGESAPVGAVIAVLRRRRCGAGSADAAQTPARRGEAGGAGAESAPKPGGEGGRGAARARSAAPPRPTPDDAEPPPEPPPRRSRARRAERRQGVARARPRRLREDGSRASAASTRAASRAPDPAGGSSSATSSRRARAAAPGRRGAPHAAPRAAGGRAPAAASRGDRVELGEACGSTTAKRMAEAKRDIPHFYASSDIAMDECARLKEGLAALGGEYTGITVHAPRAEGGAASRCGACPR